VCMSVKIASFNFCSFDWFYCSTLQSESEFCH